VIFDFEDDPTKVAERQQVSQTLVSARGRLIDTAHLYVSAGAPQPCLRS